MSRNSGFSTESLLGALTSRPEALLLLAAGAALMMRSGGDTTSRTAQGNGNRAARRRQAAEAREHEDENSRWNFEGMSSAADRAKDAAGKARNYVSDIAGRG